MHTRNRARFTHTMALAAFGLALASVARGTPMTLTNGVPLGGLSGAAGSQQVYSIDVPIYQSWLNISTSGGTGESNLYLKDNAAPTTVVYDYRSRNPGNDQSIAVRFPAEGTWYLMLQGISAYSGVTLQATFSPSPGSCVVPAPAALLLAGLGAGATGWLRRRRLL